MPGDVDLFRFRERCHNRSSVLIWTSEGLELRAALGRTDVRRARGESGSASQLRAQVYTGSVGTKNFPYFVAHTAKNSENLFFTSRGFGRIVKAPVVAFHHSGKYRTGLVGVSADRDYRVHFRIEEFVEVLRTVIRNIDPNLFHGADR